MTGWTLTMIAVAATFAPVFRARASARRLEAERSTALPEFVDLLRLSSGAGASIHQVLDQVADHTPAPFVASVDAVRRRVARGDRLGLALDELDALGEPVRPLASALRAAAFDGASLGPALDRVAVDARLRRRRDAEIGARRLPVQLLFPLIVCILPAFGLLTVVPLLLSSVGSVRF